MADTSADEFSQFPVESVARFLSVCGNEDPNLLRRSRAPTGIEARPSPPARRQITRNATQHESYLEELVSIAIASARKAEDAARQVNVADAGARRRMFAISALGAAGLLVGAAAFAGAEFEYGAPWGHAGGTSLAVNTRHSALQPAAALTGAATAVASKDATAVANKDEVQVRVADVPTAASVTTPVAVPAAPSDVASAQPDSAEATLHANARAEASIPGVAPAAVATATPLPPDKPDALFIPPLPLPPNASPVDAPRRAAERAEQPRTTAPVFARAHGVGGPTSPSQLVAAVEALETLTDERPARSSRGDASPLQFNNRM